MKRIIILLLAAAAIFAQEADFLFQQANEFYKNQDYAQAIEQYKTVLDQGYESPELYYNLGNAYFKEQEIGLTILCYERAKKLSPNDPDIDYNLKLAQLRVVDKIPEPPPFFLLKIWRLIKNLFSLQQLGLAALILWIFFASLIIILMLFRQSAIGRFSRLVITPLTAIFVICAFLFFVRLNEQNSIQDAIVVVDKVDVTSSPVSSSTQVFSLHEGVKVSITDKSGEFCLIQLVDGKVGWIKSSTLIKI